MTGATVSVAVPGKVMLAGEYAVLRGGLALAATLDRHLTVRLKPGAGIGGCQVRSDLWEGPKLVPTGASYDGEPLLAAVARGMELFKITDCYIRVDSELDVTHGIGSSSALRLGVILAFEELARLEGGAPQKRPQGELWPSAREAFLLQQQAQKRASGYDVAVQLVGGLVRFRGTDDLAKWPLEATRLSAEQYAALPGLVHLFAGGAGAPTGSVTKDTTLWLDEARLGDRMMTASETLIDAFDEALRLSADDAAVGRLAQAVAAHRQLFAGAPHFPKELAAQLAKLPGEGTTWSFKTTGAGGEDTILLVGREAALRDAAAVLRKQGWHRLKAGFETAGARVAWGGHHG